MPTKKAENKTKPERKSVQAFLKKVEPAGRREDAQVLLELMKDVTGETPVLWGSIVGFGTYHYKYESGREGDFFLTGFAPSKANMVVYVMPGFSSYEADLAKLGKHKTGKSCLYLGRLESINQEVLRRLVDRSVRFMRKKYGVK